MHPQMQRLKFFFYLFFLCVCFVLFCSGTSSGGVSPTRREQPLFTLRQVGMICERLLKEREEKVREEYEETMTSKLAGWCILNWYRGSTVFERLCLQYKCCCFFGRTCQPMTMLVNLFPSLFPLRPFPVLLCHTH